MSDPLDRLFGILERHAGLRRDVCDPDVARGLIAAQRDPRAWLDRIERSPELLMPVIARFTVHESYLFRHPEQLDAFAEDVLKECREARQATRTLRILSAGCAGGEEVWSIAITLREKAAFLAGWDVRIVGVDASEPVIAKASAGEYGPWSLRATPEAVRERWFRQLSPKRWAVLDELRAGVSFEVRNLVDPEPWPWEPGSLDVIFCRNVGIYFSDPAFRTMLARFEGLLRPGGWLFLGPTESARGLATGFDLVSAEGAFFYRRRTTGPPPIAAPAPPRRASAPRQEPRGERSRPAAAPRPPARAQPPEPPPDDVLAASAMAHLRREEFAAALKVIGEMRAEPRRELLRAVVFTNQGRRDDAAVACARVLALDPRSAAARYLSALGLEHAGDLKGARVAVEEAIDLDPTLAMPWVHLGLMARKRGDVVATRTFLTEALARLAADQPERIELFGGGFNREALLALCRSQLRAVGSGP